MSRPSTLDHRAGRRAQGAIIGILLLALGLRLWGLRYGLPYLRHPDESRYIASALLLFKTGSLDPNTLPDISISAFVYVINALAYPQYSSRQVALTLVGGYTQSYFQGAFSWE